MRGPFTSIPIDLYQMYGFQQMITRDMQEK